ncbi:NADH-quinone oxidoreductase subunit L [Planctomyces sp. SH-PL62]|uniref:NADH-quinone oxidoreductase subunit L n=1 Tax=Planctomyces sp. SH-PL62 TaxID=1636152 RepID=UPI00078E992F|nr:NADH-quinone oxidoreductase subunit L [Planctomyces sp. SH-PL62]AMV39568.1 NADH-quinone oxidoreductase subunit L [Planctomyces sp. SH-PL62]
MSGFFVQNVWLIPFFPLLGGLIAGLGARRFRFDAAIPVAIGVALAFLVSLGAWASAGPETTVLVSKWITAGSLVVPLEFRVDGLTTLMLSMVTFVSTLVIVFASGYMHGDPAYPRFFTLIGLFVFSMTGLVLSNNYLLTYAFWEGVGVCSYLLIGFWYTKPSAAAAALKAFMINRVGDVGFALAIFWLWTIVPNHDLSYQNVLAEGTLNGFSDAARIGIPLLLFWAATAKSAQLPLYVWLPDAMEGPTPVSALIHAATMVTAGVYLIARSTPLIALAPEVQLTIAIVGCATALLAALIALTQNDLKRVMAYSTVSQLGYMFMALGSGVGSVARLAMVAAMFHLFTHAFFKALLFLASGSVMHAMGDVIDMRRFRGLRHRLPYTCGTFAIGGLALAGVFPMAGFWSKDEILLALESAPHAAEHLHLTFGWVYKVIYWLAILTAFLTAFYTFRAFFMTFWGPEKLPSPDDPEAPPVDDHAAHGHGHGHDDAHGHGGHHVGEESAPIMTIPLMILAGCAVLVGVAFGPTGWFEGHLHHTLGFEGLPEGEHAFSWGTALISTIAALAGIALAYRLYAAPSPVPSRIAASIKPLYRASLDKFYVDEIYHATVMKFVQGLAAVCRVLDVRLVDRLVEGVAQVPRLAAKDVLSKYQNGLIQFYAAASALSVAVLLLVLLFS